MTLKRLKGTLSNNLGSNFDQVLNCHNLVGNMFQILNIFIFVTLHLFIKISENIIDISYLDPTL